MLVPGGSLYLEINRAYGAMMKSMLENMGYRYVELRKDMFGNDRMIKAIK
jgi:release factor glutamine methyltransferase